MELIQGYETSEEENSASDSNSGNESESSHRFNESMGDSHYWIRNVPHIPGNWASHVYIKVQNSQELKEMAENCIAHFKQCSSDWKMRQTKTKKRKRQGAFEVRRQGNSTEAQSDNDDSGHADSPLLVMNDFSPEGYQHLSLSKCFYLRQHHIEPFEKDLKKALETSPRFTFEVLEDYEVLVNDHKNRSFLCLNVGGGEQHLSNLMSKIDSVLLKYKGDPYYENPKFHISFASVLGDFGKSNQDIQNSTSEDDEIDVTAVEVLEVECKIGNRFIQIPLKR